MAIVHQIRRVEKTATSDQMANLHRFAIGEDNGPARQVKLSADRLISEMKKIHGGEWASQIDHQKRCVLIWCLD